MRRGQLAFDSLFLLLFLGMLAVTGFSVFRFYTVQGDPALRPGDLISAYESFLEEIRPDIRFSAAAALEDKTLVLTTAGGKAVRYFLTGGAVQRTADDGSSRAVLRGIQSGGFFLNEQPKDLITIWFLPEDPQGMPFFTSVALRGGLQ